MSKKVSISGKKKSTKKVSAKPAKAWIDGIKDRKDALNAVTIGTWSADYTRFTKILEELQTEYAQLYSAIMAGKAKTLPNGIQLLILEGSSDE